jgi:hypothetical protein
VLVDAPYQLLVRKHPFKIPNRYQVATVIEGKMALSFTLDSGLPTPRKRRRVLVTGANGNIGSYFAENAHDRYDLRLSVRKEGEAEKIKQYGETVVANLLELDRMKEICEGIDTVLHLAANPSPTAKWDELLEPNIVGAYNMFVAAKAAGCRRVIYASTIHTVSGYKAGMQVKTVDPVNPGDLYGVTKCFGEAMGRYMAEQEGVSCIAIRIGGFEDIEFAEKEENIHYMHGWVSKRDMHDLICKCIDVEGVRFAIFNGLSNNKFNRLDMSDAKQLLSYEPQDDFTDYHPLLKDLPLDEVSTHGMRDGDQKSGLRADLR